MFYTWQERPNWNIAPSFLSDGIHWVWCPHRKSRIREVTTCTGKHYSLVLWCTSGEIHTPGMILQSNQRPLVHIAWWDCSVWCPDGIHWWAISGLWEIWRAESPTANEFGESIDLRCDWKLTRFLDTKSPSRESCSRPRWCHSAWLAPWSNPPSHQPYHKHWPCCPDWLWFCNADMGNRNHQQCLELLWCYVGLLEWCRKIWSRWTIDFGLFRRARWLGECMWDSLRWYWF